MCIRDRPRTPPFQGGNTGSNPVGGAVCPSALLLVGDLWCSLECTPACQAGGRGFKSRQVRHLGSPRRGRVAQLVERAPEKREVTGSTPVPTTRELPGQSGGTWSMAQVEPPAGKDPAPRARLRPPGAGRWPTCGHRTSGRREPESRTLPAACPGSPFPPGRRRQRRSCANSSTCFAPRRRSTCLLYTSDAADEE